MHRQHGTFAPCAGASAIAPHALVVKSRSSKAAVSAVPSTVVGFDAAHEIATTSPVRQMGRKTSGATRASARLIALRASRDDEELDHTQRRPRWPEAGSSGDRRPRRERVLLARCSRARCGSGASASAPRSVSSSRRIAAASSSAWMAQRHVESRRQADAPSRGWAWCGQVPELRWRCEQAADSASWSCERPRLLRHQARRAESGAVFMTTGM